MSWIMWSARLDEERLRKFLVDLLNSECKNSVKVAFAPISNAFMVTFEALDRDGENLTLLSLNEGALQKCGWSRVFTRN